MRGVYHKFKWRFYHPDAQLKFNELCKSEYLSVDELMARQERARRAVVASAMTNTPFYGKFYRAAGFELGDMEHDGWFERLPVVTKKELRGQFDEFVNPQLRRFLKTTTTGGSTGTPTRVGFDRRIPEEVYSWRLQSRFGVRPWDDHAYIWRQGGRSLKARLVNAALWWPARHLKLDASFMTEQSISGFLEKYNRLRPAMLQGYVGAVTQVAQYVIDHKISVWTPKFVWTTSAPLRPSNRAVIEKAFGAKVCDEYGSCEIRWLACQCAECKGLHVNVEHVNIEFVNDDNKTVPVGEYGRTLLTNLEDAVFPLIRYENNDRGRWLAEPCSCGRTLPCIDSVKGREVESFVLPSGKMVNGEFLTTIFDSDPDVATNFRVIQHQDLSITVQYVPGDRKLPDRIPETFAKAIGGEVKVDFMAVDSLASDRGKLRFVVRER